VSAVPRRRRERREPTHDWQEIQQQTLWPEQEWYEKLRPMLLFGQTAASRAKETGTSERTLHYKADQFEQEGMASLFPNERTSTAVSPGRNLPEDLRQLIVDLPGSAPWFYPT
jgi:hypothetical protein